MTTIWINNSQNINIVRCLKLYSKIVQKLYTKECTAFLSSTIYMIYCKLRILRNLIRKAVCKYAKSTRYTRISSLLMQNSTDSSRRMWKKRWSAPSTDCRRASNPRRRSRQSNRRWRSSRSASLRCSTKTQASSTWKNSTSSSTRNWTLTRCARPRTMCTSGWRSTRLASSSRDAPTSSPRSAS